MWAGLTTAQLQRRDISNNQRSRQPKCQGHATCLQNFWYCYTAQVYCLSLGREMCNLICNNNCISVCKYTPKRNVWKDALAFDTNFLHGSKLNHSFLWSPIFFLTFLLCVSTFIQKSHHSYKLQKSAMHMQYVKGNSTCFWRVTGGNGTLLMYRIPHQPTVLYLCVHSRGLSWQMHAPI